MSNTIIWFAWFVSIGVVYVTVLRLLHLRNKDEKRRLSQLRVKADLYSRVNAAIQKEIDDPKEPKSFRDLYVFDKDAYRLDRELNRELERLKRWGKRHQ